METFLNHFALRWWVALAGVGIHFIVGMLWYGPFFGQRWMQANSMSEEEIKNGPYVSIYVSSLITSLVATYGVGFIVHATGATSIAHALAIVAAVWLTLNVAPFLNHLNFEGRPKALVYINTLFDLVVWLLIAILVVIS